MAVDLKLAIDAIKSGDKNKGRSLLANILKQDAHNGQAWLWMAAAMDEREKQIYCLQKALEIDPNNQIAQKRLVKLNAAIVNDKSEEFVLPQTVKELRPQRTTPERTTPVVTRKKASQKTITPKFLIATIGIAFTAVVTIMLLGIILTSIDLTDESQNEATTLPTLPPTYTPISQAPGNIDEIQITQTNLADYFEIVHEFDWSEFHYPGGDHRHTYVGLAPDKERRLTIWSENDDTENIRIVAYALSFNKNVINEQRIADGMEEMVDIVVLCLPNWQGGEDWILNSFKSVPDFYTVREFETEVDQVSVVLSVGPEQYGDLYIILLDLYEK